MMVEAKGNICSGMELCSNYSGGDFMGMMVVEFPKKVDIGLMAWG